MDYEKAYKAVLQTATQWIKDGCTDKEKICLECVFPELKESEDERIRKELIDFVNHYRHNTDLTSEQAEWCKKALAYLEKQEERKEETLRDFIDDFPYSDQKEQKEIPLMNGDADLYFDSWIQQHSNPTKRECFKGGMLYAVRLLTEDSPMLKEFKKGFEQAILWGREGYKVSPDGTTKSLTQDEIDKVLDKQKEQRPAEGREYSCPDCGTTFNCTNDESEGDKRYREGIRYALNQTENYTIGKTFKGLIPCWVNAPSELQPAHKYHGRNAVIMHENNGGFRCCFIDDEKATTIHLTEDTIFVEGWRKKPAEWSEKDESMHTRCCGVLGKCAIGELPLSVTEEFDWLKSLPERFNLQPKNEWSEEDEEKLKAICTYLRDYSRLAKLGDKLRFNEYCDFLKSLRPQPIQLKEAYKDGFQTARHAIALTFMNFLDENRPEGKMSLSNGECEDIDKAFNENDWAKILRYAEKYGRRN